MINLLTKNGFSHKEEKRLLHSWHKLQKERNKNQTQTASVSDFLNQF